MKISEVCCGTFYRICDNCLCTDENNPWVVTMATNAVDSYPMINPMLTLLLAFIGEQENCSELYSTDN